LASGRLTGKIRRGLSAAEGSRRGLRPEDGPFVEDGHLFTIIEAIDEIARETGTSVTQIALNWLLQRPTVASLITGARNETQLSENFGAIGWEALTPIRFNASIRPAGSYRPILIGTRSDFRREIHSYVIEVPGTMPLANSTYATFVS
jgi:aryl-alcohol dehydrogenase-like predicted oxidoreductase